MNETSNVKSLYDNLTPYHDRGETVFVVNNSDGLRYLTVAQASEAGDAGGGRMTTSTPHRLYPGLNRVTKAYWDRVEADAARQRQRSGGILAKMIDDGQIEVVKDLAKTSTSKVSGWLSASADIELVKDLRDHPKHGDAAQRAFDAWHSYEASEETKKLRHFWAMSTGSKKVA